MDNDAKKLGELAILIYESIFNADDELTKYTPDALIRVYVSLAFENGWTLKKIHHQAIVGINYYYGNQEEAKKKKDERVD
jgi:hypothetical protein